MYVRVFGADYYLNEKTFVERMTQAASDHPWRTEEIIAIQRQMKDVEDRIFEHVRQTAMPDPLETLRRHIDEMIAADSQETEKQ